MFTEIYPAIYHDRSGKISTTIYNNGKELRMTLRGIQFIATTLDGWEIDGTPNITQLQQFTFHHKYELCDYTLEFDIPVSIRVKQARSQAQLHVQLILGTPTHNGNIDKEQLVLTLLTDKASFKSQGKSGGFFEDELLDIQKQLPEGIDIQTCFFCAFSDYSPLGNSMFGGLACFRDNKQKYLQVKSKADIFALWETLTEFVQETHYCNEFEERKTDTGYRG